VGGKIYVIGARNFSSDNNQVWEYDPATQSWTQKANMPTGRGQAACAVVDAKIYVVGGNNSAGNNWLTTFERYDPATNLWTTLPSLPTSVGRGFLSAAAVDGLIYAMGGGNSYYTTGFSENYIYNPQTNGWTTGAPLPKPRTGHGAAVIDGRIYLARGQHQDIENRPMYANDIVDVYDPATNSWSTAAPLTYPRHFLDVVAMHGRMYAIGGCLSPDGEDTKVAYVEEHDPRDDYWRIVTFLPTARYLSAAAVADGEIFVFGGRVAHASELNSVLAGIARPVHGDINNDGALNFGDINPFVECIIHGGCCW
jgi:N-acetylneuraminic acid mutarotase